MDIIKSVGLFTLAGLCEIGGGYLVWLWLREGKSIWIGLIGGVILVLYGIVATLQPATFGRVYAAYGGIFIVMAIFWGWMIDKKTPDRFELIGGFIALIGMLIIMYWPRQYFDFGHIQPDRVLRQNISLERLVDKTLRTDPGYLPCARQI